MVLVHHMQHTVCPVLLLSVKRNAALPCTYTALVYMRECSILCTVTVVKVR